MKKLLLSSMLVSASLYAYTLTDLSVEFTAFKTYAKKGVNGKFDKLNFKHTNAKTLKKMLLNSEVKIKTSGVNTGNETRDKKLVTKFFDIQGVQEIDANIVGVDDTTIFVSLKMHGKTLNVPMTYTASNNTIKAKGTIDVADFAMLPSLKSINKACYDLHKGKTWQDVDISFEILYTK